MQLAACLSLKKPMGSYTAALATLNRNTVLSWAAVASSVQSADMANACTGPAT